MRLPGTGYVSYEQRQVLTERAASGENDTQDGRLYVSLRRDYRGFVKDVLHDPGAVPQYRDGEHGPIVLASLAAFTLWVGACVVPPVVQATADTVSQIRQVIAAK